MFVPMNNTYSLRRAIRMCLGLDGMSGQYIFRMDAFPGYMLVQCADMNAATRAYNSLRRGGFEVTRVSNRDLEVRN